MLRREDVKERSVDRARRRPQDVGHKSAGQKDVGQKDVGQKDVGQKDVGVNSYAVGRRRPVSTFVEKE